LKAEAEKLEELSFISAGGLLLSFAAHYLE
jgi:hypothetical protein